MATFLLRRADEPFHFKDVRSIPLTQDVIKIVLEEEIDVIDRNGIKELGQIYTPEPIVKNIYNMLNYTVYNEIENIKLLDPSCGMGAFLYEAIKRLRSYLIIKYNYDSTHINDAIKIVTAVINNVIGIDVSEIVAKNALISYLLPLKNEIMTITDNYKSFNYNIPIYIFDALDPMYVNNIEFDMIIGNPPYIQYNKINPLKRNIYKKNYTTAYKKYNIYSLFFERSISWLKNKGVLGFICSNRFFYTDYGFSLRRYLLNNAKIINIIDFKDKKVFKSVDVYPAIITLEKMRNKLSDEWTFPYSYINKSLNDMSNNDAIYSNINQINIDQDKLNNDIWLFIPNQLKMLLNELEKDHTPFYNVIDKISVGIATGCNEVFLFKEKPTFIEEELLLPILRGKDIKKNKIVWDNTFILNPYTKKEGNITPILLENFPQSHHYLSKYRELLSLKYHVKEKKKKWYETHDSIDSSLLTKPKIVYPDISPENRFSVEYGRYHCLNTCNYILTKSILDLEYIASVLNSELYEFILKIGSPKIKSNRYRYMKRYIRNLPMLNPVNIENRFKKLLIKHMKVNNWKEINRLVYELYEISEDQQKAITEIMQKLL